MTLGSSTNGGFDPSGSAVNGEGRRPRSAALAILVMGLGGLTSLLIAVVARGAAPTNSQTILVSRASGPTGDAGFAYSFSGQVSADGRFVAFYSESDLLVPPCGCVSTANGQVYVRDLETNTTSLVSRANGTNGAPAGPWSGEPSISGDGRFVAFASGANAASEQIDQVYVRDTVAGTTTLVSRGDGSNGVAANGTSVQPSISTDGRFVAFVSNADNIGDPNPGNHYRVYVRDIREGRTILVSRTDGVGGTPGGGDFASLSGDGRFVVFVSGDRLTSDDPDPSARVFVRDLLTSTTRLVTPPTGPFATGHVPVGTSSQLEEGTSISQDGHAVAFGWQDPSGNASWVYYRNLNTGSTVLASAPDGVAGTPQPSVGPGNPSNGNLYESPGWSSPAVSPDGRFVAFDSSDELTNDGSEGPQCEQNRFFCFPNVYVRDVAANTLTLVSRASGAAGARGNNGSFSPSISTGGRLVVFTSQATNLTADSGGPSRVFARAFHAGPPTAQIISPSSGATFTVGLGVHTIFSCTDDSNGPGIASCNDSHGVSSPGQLDTSKPGTFTYTVTALSQDGQTGTASATYTIVVRPPSVHIASPRSGATFTFGQYVRTSFACTDGFGPGIARCTDTHGLTSPGRLDTSKPGTFTYTVNALSEDGQTSRASVTYNVVDNRFKITHLHTERDGKVLFTLVVPGPGMVDVLETAQPGRFVFARRHVQAPRAGGIGVIVAPNGSGQRLIAHHPHGVVLRVWVSYIPRNGAQRNVGLYRIVINPRHRLSHRH